MKMAFYISLIIILLSSMLCASDSDIFYIDRGVSSRPFDKDDWVYVWYGNLDQSPIETDIGVRIPVDVYIQTSENAYCADFSLAVGFDNAYIDSLLSRSEGQLFWPFTEWDTPFFYGPGGSPPNPEGWKSESFFGLTNTGAPYDDPWLHLDTPHLGLRFIVKSKNDETLQGQTVNAMGRGWNFVWGVSNCGDTTGSDQYPITEYYSQIHFSGGGAIEGHITDTQEMPIADIAVNCQVTYLADTSDQDGYYLINGLYGGLHDIKFSHPEYVDTIVEDVNIIEDNTTPLDVVLQRSGYILGMVYDQNSEPFSDVQIVAINTTTDDTATAVTDTNGSYYLENLHSGLYTITHSHIDYYDTTLTGIEVNRGDTSTATMQMTYHEIIDVGTVALISPPENVYTGSDWPVSVRVANYGNTEQSFDVTVQAFYLDSNEPVYNHTITTPILQPGTDSLLNYEYEFTPVIDTTFLFVVYTDLSGDENTANDTVTAYCVSAPYRGFVFVDDDTTAGSAYDVALMGNIAIVADWADGISLYDITNAEDPALLGTCNTPGYARAVAYKGNYIYLADGMEGLQVISIADPEYPYLIHTIPTGGNCYSVLVADSLLLIGSGNTSTPSFIIADLSDPSFPEIISENYHPGNTIRRIAVKDNYVYLAALTLLEVVDIANTYEPVLASSTPLNDYVYDIKVASGYAYLANGTKGLAIFDISDPENPSLCSYFDTPGNALGVTLYNGIALVSDYESGIHAIDITDPYHPVLINSYSELGEARKSVVSDDLIYIASTRSLITLRFIGNYYGMIEGAITGDELEYIQNVNITVAGTTIRDFSKLDGAYALCGLDAGVYDISFSHPEYYDTVITGVQVVAGESSDLNVTLQGRVGIDDDAKLPSEYTLNQNYPNPFNGTTLISYNLKQPGWTKLTVFDILGKKIDVIIDEYQAAGHHQREWHADNKASGMYFYRLETSDYSQTRRMLLIK